MKRLLNLPEITVEIQRYTDLLVLNGEVNGSFVHLGIGSTNSENIDSILNLIKSINGQYPLKTLDFYSEKVIMFANKNFEIFEKPQLSNSKEKGSQSLYLGQTKNREILIQAQPPLASSSKHAHDGPEFYHHVCGNLYVENGEVIDQLHEDQPQLTVANNINHRVYTDENPAISLIVCNFTSHIYA